MDEHAIRIATLGFEKRSLQILIAAIGKKFNGQLSQVDIHLAQVILVDLDNHAAGLLLDDIRRSYPDIPLLGIGKPSDKQTLQPFLAKPLNPDQVINTILELANPVKKQATNMITNEKIAKAMQAMENRNIARSLHKRAEQNQPKSAVKRAMPSKTDEMCFDPERFLLGVVIKTLEQANQNLQTAEIQCGQDRVIVIDTMLCRISSNLSDSQIRTSAIAPLNDGLLSSFQINYYTPGNFHNQPNLVQANSELRHFSQEVFMWNLGQLTSRGRIPHEIAVCNRYFLRRWPNLTRMNVPANAMRILAYWRQQPCSLMEIKEQLDVPLQDVFTVFSAAHAAGLIGEAKCQADELMQAIPVANHGIRSVMKSIIQRLRGNNAEQHTAIV